MNCLPPETQKQLKKISAAFLTAKLSRAVYDLDRLEELEKADLLEALAGTMLAEQSPKQIWSGWRVRRRKSFFQPRIRAARRLTEVMQLSGFKSLSSKRNGKSESERNAKPREKSERLLVRQKNKGRFVQPKEWL